MTDYERMFERAMDENPPTLSQEGASRRAAMASELIQALRRRRRTRTAARSASLLAAAAALLFFFWPRTPMLPEPALPGPETTSSAVLIVRNDPLSLSRYVVGNRPSRVAILDDQDLLRALERAGHPSGILRAGSRVILTNPLPEPNTE